MAHTMFTTTEVEMTIRSLNRNKAADKRGITAEHLIHATTQSVSTLTSIINRIFSEARAPKECKSGYKLPIPKKGKDSQIRTNYRGITITALIGKIVEHLLQDSTEVPLKKRASHQQFGFTRGLAPSMATLCLNEAIASAKCEKKKLFVATLDAQKAFDVVNIPKLKQKVHMAGVTGNHWLLIDSLYSDIEECVRWKGSYSTNFTVHKGVRQGAIMSTSLYKTYVNDLLHTLEKSGNGMKIGNIYIGSPTCADDILLLSDNKEELQAMITTCHKYAVEHQYKLHPEKSTVTPFLNASEEDSGASWYMGEDKMSTTQDFTHLGIKWQQGKLTPGVEERIRLARRTVYALMGAGIHGENGLSPKISCHVIQTYVTPRLLYGLEAVVLTKKQREDLTSYHRQLLRQIQGLPQNVAKEAVYMLLGEIPLEGELDIRILTLYGAICNAKENTIMDKITTRQLGTDNKHSWFYQILLLCQKYNIDLASTSSQPWRKATWKDYITTTVRGYWLRQVMEGAMQKTSTRWINLTFFRDLQEHPVWSSCQYNSRAVPGAMVRAKLLTRTYMLQERKAKFSMNKEDPCCPLCGEAPEDLEHFLLHCKATDKVRQKRFKHLQELGYDLTTLSPTRKIHFILNGPLPDTSLEANRILNGLCHGLHHSRFSMLVARNSTTPNT